MEDEYLNLLRLFQEIGVEYVVVGGYAVIAHGFPRTTGDLDILVRPSTANARRVVQALERFGYTDGEFEETDFTTVPNFISFASNGVWIDLMTQLLGVSLEDCLNGSLELTFAGVPVQHISLAALRQTKRATGRPQDLRDLENLPE
ncbi:hypothetical protein GCM10011375_00660 [Hymenobacter qilianensis]|uniref:Uncharacterized protein n=2 Tax=Hymenobacter qilianensis TaxID=1385715 RepID=A0ACB5PL23_9BACT|nr:nucleotidyltransferase [Hymenobacter qilianensis]QNP50964.1 nucleotidyltransferase [Hymenobacter qilianensis]GGF49024.1 hypothetical protein GCM10011375_00660 [Hymenobacter qilianensis]